MVSLSSANPYRESKRTLAQNSTSKRTNVRILSAILFFFFFLWTKRCKSLGCCFRVDFFCFRFAALLSSSQLSSFSNSCHNINLDSHKQVGLHDVNLLSILICGNKFLMKFCEEKCEVGDARCSRNSSRKQLIYELLWFSRIRDLLAYSLRFEARFIVYPSFGHAIISKD